MGKIASVIFSICAYSLLTTVIFAVIPTDTDQGIINAVKILSGLIGMVILIPLTSVKLDTGMLTETVSADSAGIENYLNEKLTESAEQSLKQEMTPVLEKYGVHESQIEFDADILPGESISITDVRISVKGRIIDEMGLKKALYDATGFDCSIISEEDR